MARTHPVEESRDLGHLLVEGGRNLIERQSVVTFAVAPKPVEVAVEAGVRASLPDFAEVLSELEGGALPPGWAGSRPPRRGAWQ